MTSTNPTGPRSSVWGIYRTNSNNAKSGKVKRIKQITGVTDKKGHGVNILINWMSSGKKPKVDYKA